MKFLVVLLSISLFLIVSCKNDSGVSTPQIRIISVTPSQVTAGGKDLPVEISGNGFSSVSSVSCGNDVTVQTFEVLGPTHIRISIEVPVDAAPGPRTVTVLTASGSATLDAGLVIVENKKPKASFTINPPSGSQGTLFTLDARDSSDPDGRIKKYHWDFGDGTEATQAVAKHRFESTGKLEVTLTITDEANLEDTARRTVRVDFDPAVAFKQIDAVCKEFLTLFGELETLSAEEIVVGFSTSRGCHGRQHEIDIINRHKAEGGFVNVDILPPTEVQNLTELSATSNLGARFHGRHRDGTSFDGIVTHYFEMQNGPSGWKICNFRAQ